MGTRAWCDKEPIGPFRWEDARYVLSRADAAKGICATAPSDLAEQQIASNTMQGRG